MKYRSTRGDAARPSFCDILIEGLAPDGGLYLPEHYPQVDFDTLKKWQSLSYDTLAFEVMKLYIDDIPEVDLRRLLKQTYTEKVFGTSAIAPVRQLKPDFYILELSNGPTHAFKDMAMQWLGTVFEYELGRRQKSLNILGATSGDTGSAAQYAMRGKRGIEVFMTSPQGRMSEFQQAQMFSLADKNIHNAALAGVFDDCQDIVKAISKDASFKSTYNIGTVNSINWARVLAQVVYYFHAYLQTAKKVGAEVSFTVPSGNFGNVCAGHIAKMMGLPIRRLVVATNENNVLHEFFSTGKYRPRSSQETLETSSPSMDISKASNLERFVFDLLQGDCAYLSDVFENQISKPEGWQLTPAEHVRLQSFGFHSGASSHEMRMKTTRQVYQDHARILDPHTADGVVVAATHIDKDVPMIVLETALALKFSGTVQEALGFLPPLPTAAQDLLRLPRRVEVMPASTELVKAWIKATLTNQAVQN